MIDMHGLFTENELSCNCGCGFMPLEVHQHRLLALRLVFDHPMNLSSAGRCIRYNMSPEIKGTDTGPHVELGGIDVLIFGKDALDLVQAAYDQRWHGIGVKQKGVFKRRFVHIDLRPWQARTIWTY